MPNKWRVMIVDDERNFSESLQLAIEDQYEVTVANTLDSARAEITRAAPDAILLDLHLPDGNGLELLREMKKSARPPVVLIMTAFATIQSFLEAANLQAEDYIHKPLNIDRLKMQIHNHLAARARV